jgi:hypothetical protein
MMNKEILGVKVLELVLFTALGVVYVGFQLWWTIMVAANPGAAFPFLAGQAPQSVNNNVLLLFLTLFSLAFAGAAMVVIKNKKDQRPVPMFLMRIGLALSIYSSAGQIIAVFIPAAKWTLPAEGIPVMHALTICVTVGIILAGIGGNMAWGHGRREEFLAATKKKR